MNKSLTKYIKESIDLLESLKKAGKLSDLEEITYPDGRVVNIKKDVEEKYRLACFYIYQNFPYFAPAIKSLLPIITNAVKTMATDGIRLFMNPRFTADLTDNETVFVILHECMHCILNHMSREKAAGFSDHHRANIAADYECNGILDTGDDSSSFVKPGTIKNLKGFIDRKYDGWAFERIYADKDMKEDGRDPENMGDPQSEQGQGQGQGQDGNGGASGSQQDRGPDYKAGYEQAIKDYNEGKLKI